MFKTLIIALALIFASLNLYSQSQKDLFLLKDNSAVNIGKYAQQVSKNNNAIIDSMIIIPKRGPKTKILVDYLKPNQINSLVFSFLDNDSTWQKYLKVIYTYDSFGRTSNILEQWLPDSIWTNSFTDIFTYDSLGNKIMDVSKIWNGQDWENLFRTSNKFYKNGDKVSMTERYLNGSWINFNKITAYFSKGLKSSELIEEFENNYWVIKRLNEFSYDESNNLISVVDEQWDGTDWNNYMRINIKHDTLSNQTSQLIDIWDNNNWIKYGRFLYKYNLENNLEHASFDAWENGGWVGEDNSIYINSPEYLDLHFLTHRVDIYYHNSLTDISSNKKNEPETFQLFQNYPNPFNPATKISYQLKEDGYVSLNVYNLIGEEVAKLVNEVQSQGLYSINFNAGSLPSGIYFYKIHSNSSTAVKKMILLK